MSDSTDVSRPWDIQTARNLYNINGWGAKYFDINEAGHVVDEAAQAVLLEVGELCRGHRLGVRLEHRRRLLCAYRSRARALRAQDPRAFPPRPSSSDPRRRPLPRSKPRGAKLYCSFAWVAAFLSWCSSTVGRSDRR